METGFTPEPSRPGPHEAVVEVIFNLDKFDYVDYWMWTWDREAEARGPAPSPARGGWVLWAMLALALMALAGTNLKPSAWPGLFLAAGLALAVGWLVIRRGGADPQGREAHLRQVSQNATALEQAGQAINPARIYWLQLTAEGVREVGELRRQPDAGVLYYEYQEHITAWAAVQDVALTARHVFVRDAEGAYLVPRRCFAGAEDLSLFLDAVYRLRSAARAAPAAPAVAPAHPEGVRAATGVWEKGKGP